MIFDSCFLGITQVLKITYQLKYQPPDTKAVSAQGLFEQLLIAFESFTFQSKIPRPW